MNYKTRTFPEFSADPIKDKAKTVVGIFQTVADEQNIVIKLRKK